MYININYSIKNISVCYISDINVYYKVFLNVVK